MSSTTLVVPQKSTMLMRNMSSTHFHLLDQHRAHADWVFQYVWLFKRPKKTLMTERSHPALAAILLHIWERDSITPALTFLTISMSGRREWRGSPRAGRLHGRDHGEGERPQGKGRRDCSCRRSRKPPGQCQDFFETIRRSTAGGLSFRFTIMDRIVGVLVGKQNLGMFWSEAKWCYNQEIFQ